MKPYFSYSPQPVLAAQPNCPWADTMVLNPAILAAPGSSDLIMLFRATGPWPQKRLAGHPMPYPIFLGYAVSHDNGLSWIPNFSRPALAPALEYEADRIYITDINGKRVPNYYNGCIEDPRLFTVDDEIFMTAACRMFPPGTYWIKDVPEQCVPAWGLRKDNPFGRAAWGNVSVTVLFKVNIAELLAQNYEEAFTFVTHLTDPQRGENRDAFLFSEKMNILGKQQYVGLHRPWESHWFTDDPAVSPVSMFMVSADTFADFPGPRARHALFAERTFPWEAERVGGSWPPLKLSADEWLVAYHGKQDAVMGYSQSFMIIRKQDEGFPGIVHRCSERLMFPKQPWELDGRFKTPCLFTCAGIVMNGELIMSYGAADEKVGIARVNFEELLDYIRLFDSKGNMTPS
ncbi:MAG: hypothetical protein ABSA01_14910 [Anaerolineales bacterium]|jgi:predicted GH43/DUF377 family glycosyl hydrolase